MVTLVVGCNHHSATVAKREQVAFGTKAVPRALAEFKQRFAQAEVILLSTCNRLEFYVAHPDDSPPCATDVIQFIADFHGLDPTELRKAFYIHEGDEAVRHLFRVISSLDSMVLGESEILGQTRTAFDTARQTETVGQSLEPLFQRALGVAKEVRSQTEIAAGRLSVGSTAVDLARQIFSHFNDKTVLMVGAGEMGELTLTHLMETRPQRLWVTNRTDGRAVEVAERLEARHERKVEPIPYHQWIDRLAEVDIVITCTGSRDPILTPESFAPIPARRGYSPILVIDIAVPRDVEPAVGKNDGVYTQATLTRREEAVAQCHAIIETAVIAQLHRRQRRDLTPTIRALEDHFREICQKEMGWLSPKLDQVPEHERELIEQMLHRITCKLMHRPVQRLHGEPADESHDDAETLKRLFDLNPDDNTTTSND